MSGSTNRKRTPDSASLRYGEFAVERRFVGGPLDGKIKGVPPSQDRFYVAGLTTLDAAYPVNDAVTDTGSFRQGTYELFMNYRRERVFRWLGWDDEREYERMRIDNESPDYHG